MTDTTISDLEDIIDAEVVEDMTEPVARTKREQTIHELRQFLDFLETNDDIVIPYDMNKLKFYNVHTAQEAAKIVKRIGGRWEKNNPKSGNDYDEQYFTMKRKLEHEVEVVITLSRGIVCDRKVIGQEMKSVPVTTTIYVEKLVDVAEFECGSLLSAAEKASMAELEAL